MEKRMYVLILKDMRYIDQAVQAGHAVAKYVMQHKSEWTNGTLIYLEVENEEQLEWYEIYLVNRRINSSTFIEPDWGDVPVKTALACVANPNEFELLKTLKMPKGSKLYQWYKRTKYRLLNWRHK
jgi:hypothetical protein